MIPRICVPIAFALLLAAIPAAAQDALETRGAWRLVAAGEGFALRTQAISATDSAFSLICRKGQGTFGFEIRSPALAALPQGEDLRVGVKVDGDDQVWLTLPTGPDGTVPITHETAVWLVHGALRRDAAKELALSAGGHTWQFALDGLAGLTESLAARCGFALSPAPPPGR